MLNPRALPIGRIRLSLDFEWREKTGAILEKERAEWSLCKEEYFKLFSGEVEAGGVKDPDC